MADSILKLLRVPVPTHGLMEGLDPASPDSVYSPEFSPRCENVRFLQATWQTRRGMAVWDPDSNAATTTLGATGKCNLLANVYLSNGTIYRLAGLAGTLKQMASGGTSFANATNGTGFSATNLWQGITQRDTFYFTDRNGALKKWDATNGVQSVTQPTAPAAAPGTRRRIWGILEAWDGSGGTYKGWTALDNTNFGIANGNGSTDPDLPQPGAGAVTKLTINNSGSRSDTISENVTGGETLNSHYIAFWFESTSKNALVSFDIGVNAAAEFSYKIQPPVSGDPLLFFVPIGNLSSIRYKQFRCTKVPNATQKLFIGQLFLPGRLQGQYRWRYTHKDPLTGSESKPSPATEFVDCSAVGVNYKSEDSTPLEKAVELKLASDSGSNSNTTQRCIYRNGGTPSLTKDSRGQEVWNLLATVMDLSTTLNGATLVGATSATLTAVQVGSGSRQQTLAANDWLVFEPGVDGKEEFVQVDTVNTSTKVVTFKTALKNAHANGVTVDVGYVDNTANESIDVTTRLEVERDDPPSGSYWLSAAPDGRMWLARWSGRPMGVAISNLPVPGRTADQEVFPDNVSPLVRQSPTQGFRFDLSGDASGDQIMWAGFYQGLFTAITTRAVYRVYAYGQSDWGPSSVAKVIDGIGCLAGETVAEVNGALYWVADGPRVMRWDGHSAPEEFSFLRLTTTLQAAPSAYWDRWFARAHADENGIYYRLCIVPSGETTPCLWLDYNVNRDAWEPRAHYDGSGNRVPFSTALAWNGPGDARELYAGHFSSGDVYRLEYGDDDAGVAIKVRCDSKKLNLPAICQMERFFLRGDAYSDTVSVAVATGGSEYAQGSSSYSVSLSGTDDVERLKRVDFTARKGRWVQFSLTGDVSHRPAFREITLEYTVIRDERWSS